MAGLFGVITKQPSLDATSRLERMTQAVVLQPGNIVRNFSDESSSVYASFVGRGNRNSEAMPLKNERGDVTLLFSGEEYPALGTAGRLRELGHDVPNEGPGYLVHLYEEDSTFPAGLNGRFHGLIVDRGRGEVIIFNDRFGMHRLYYYETKDAFYFAGEAKAILAVCPETRQLDVRGAGEFISCGAVLENRTLFQGIRVLPPGSAWYFQNGSLQRKTTYFQPREWEDQQHLDSESFYRELREVWQRNLPRYFAGDQAIGMSLTGGLDSRIILANHKSEPGSLPCYTFGSMFRENSDVRVAKRIAAVLRQPHQVIPVGDEFLSQFGDYAERTVLLSDGCLDVGRAPDLYVNEKASQIAPVRVAGTYGGEVLRGVRAFKAEVPAAGLFSGEIASEVQRTKQTCSDILKGHPVSFAVFKLSPWALYGVLGVEETQLSVRAPFLDNDFVRTVFRAPLSALESYDSSLRLIGDGNKDLLSIPTDRGLAGSQGRFVSKINRAYQNFTFKCEYAYDMGMPQWLARVDNFLGPLHLEKQFLGRHKVFHFRTWYRRQLSEYLKSVLLDSRALSRPYIERKKAESIVREHVTGAGNYTNEIHRLLTLELINRLLLEKEAVPVKNQSPQWATA